jgi:purine-cytosine permease-like protein
MSRNDKILMVVAAVCGILAVGGWSWNVSAETFAQYIGTIVATFAGVGLAAYLSVRQFYSQAEQVEATRRQQLATSLAAELYALLDILAGPPHFVVGDPTGGTNNIPAVFAQLEPTATEEAIRLGLLEPQSTSNLYQISSLMRE